MIMAQQHAINEQQTDDQSRPRQNRSPSIESGGRRHQQSGGFAHHQYRRPSFSKDGNGGYNGNRRQNYQRGGRGNNSRGGMHHHNHQNGYHQFEYPQRPRYHQNNSNFSHHSKPLFPAAQENAPYSYPAPMSSPLHSPGATLHRRSDFPENKEILKEKQTIHNYRSAGTGIANSPGGGIFSNRSSPFKQTMPTPEKVDPQQDEWAEPKAPKFARGGPSDSQQKTMTPPVEIPKTLPERNRGGGAPRKTNSTVIDTVEPSHAVFADERMVLAMRGACPEVKSKPQQSVQPILNEQEAGQAVETLQQLHLQKQMAGLSVKEDTSFFTPIQRNFQGKQTHEVAKVILPARESSTDSRKSSKVHSEETAPQKSDVVEKEEITVESAEKPQIPTEAVEKMKNTVETLALKDLPSKSRRDSDCSSASAQPHASGLDESTLTKIYPGQEYRGERGVASPAPPTSLISEKLSQMDVLSEKIWHEHNKVSQTDEMLQRKLHLRDMLYTAISPVFPMSGLYVVGSSLNGFGNNSSDMDLCLMITNKDLDQKNDAVVVLNLILSTLQYEKFVSSQKLILAKVPILRIKFAEPFEDITVDLNANNSVAIRNTHLLCYYSSYDWRVRPLVSAVKEWAKRKGINDANKSSFTSYSLVLMVIHYLQCGTTPRVLPNLQQAYPNRFSNKVDVRTLNVTMPLDPIPDDKKEKEESTSTPTSSEKATLGELLIGFLDYYANKFDYDRDAISIRQGRRVERAALAVRPKMQHGGSSDGDKETPPPSSSASSSSLHNGGASSTIPQHFWRSQWRCVCIEEPFTNSNTAHSIYDEMVFGAIKEAFREAHTELQNNYDLEKLMQCEPIKTSITNAGAAVFAATYEGERPPNSNSMPPGGLRGMQPQAVPIPFHYAPPPIIPMPQSAQQNHSVTSQLPPMPSMPLQQQQQQRGGAGGYPMMFQNNQRSNNHHNQQSSSFNPNQHNRRTNNQNGGASRSSRSNESVKENRQNQNQRYPTTSTSSGANGQQKENVAVVTSDAAENKNSQNVQNLQSKPKGAKNDEGAKTKRTSNTVAAVESGEKLPMSPSKVAQ